MITKKEQDVLDLNSPQESYYYCMHNEDANVELHQDIIINSTFTNAIYVYLFALNIKKANVNKLEEAIIKFNDAEYAFYFAMDVVGSNIERLEEVVINYGTPDDIYWFAHDVKKSNKENLFKHLLSMGNIFWINKFIKNISLSQELKELAIFI